MKFSKYNIIHTTENQEHILFNSLWGSTFVISPSVKQAIESSNPTLLTEEENRLFIVKILISFHLNGSFNDLIVDFLTK